MRHKLIWCFTTMMIFSVFSCDYEDDREIIENIPHRSDTSGSIIQQIPPGMEKKSPDKLIVRFNSSASEFEKTDKRKLLKVESYTRCACGDSGIELWDFDLDSLPKGGIEEIKTKVDTDPDLEGSDFHYTIDLSGSISTGATASSFQQYVVPNNSGVTIAVIDSGLDPSVPEVKYDYLYNSSLNNTCGQTSPSGWDFVENDSVPQDMQGHGTIVTSIIAEYLKDQNVDFQILPIRAFDHRGKGNMFNIACAIQYAVKNPDVDVINMSFGWYYNSSEIIEKLLTEASDSKVMISSAGNSHNNNNIIPHYPSGYSLNNMFAIASHDQLPTALAPFSNFGNNSVDIAAPGSFTIGAFPADVVFEGTSFSAAFASAKSAEIIGTQSPLTAPFYQYMLSASTYRSALDNGSLLQYPYTIDP